MDMVRQSSGLTTLGEYLERHSETGPLGCSVATAVDAIATACIEISDLARGGASPAATDIILGTNADGDVQKDLDIRADWLIRRALASASIAAFASEEMAKPEFYDPASRLCVAVDPLAELQHLAAGVGQQHALAGPLHDRQANLLLQLMQLLGHRRLRQSKLVGGGRDATALGDRGERTQLPDRYIAQV